MTVLTPKLKLRKPDPNVEPDWAFRLNENTDILDNATLTNNITGVGSVTVTDDGSGNVIISGTGEGGGGVGIVANALVGSDGITVTSGSAIDDIAGFRGEFVATSGSLQTQIDIIGVAGVTSINSESGTITVTGTTGVNTITTLNTITLTTEDSEIDHDALLNFTSTEHFTEASIDHTNILNIGSNTHTQIDSHLDDLAASGVVTNTLVVSVSGHLQNEIDAVESSDVDSVNALVGAITITGSPNFPIRTEGQSIIVSGTDFIGNLDRTYDGTRNSQAYTYAINSDGATISLTLDAPTNFTIVQISGTNIVHPLPSSVDLTPAGIDSNPQENWIFLLFDGVDSMTMTSNTSGFPTAPHSRIARAIVQTPATVSGTGPLKLQSYTDHYNESDPRGSIGHIHAISERIRAQFSEWQSGTLLSTTTDTGPTPDDITIQVAAGIVYQLHTQDTPALDTSDSDVMHVFNDFTTPFTTIQSLSELTLYNDGSTIGTTDRFNVVLWATSAENPEDTKLFINIPSSGYNGDVNAINDSNNTAVFIVPRDFAGVGWLLARLTIKRSAGGNTWTIINNQDLRGATPGTFAGGVAIGGGGVTDHGLLTGLTDDDHAQYSRVDGGRPFTATIGGVTPTADEHLTTKLYVDTDTSALAASGIATNVAVTANTSLITTTSGHLQSEIDDTVSTTNALAASGVADELNLVTISGHLQGEIDATQPDVDAITVSGGSDTTGDIDFVGAGGVNVSKSGQTFTFDGTGIIAGGGGGGGNIDSINAQTGPAVTITGIGPIQTITTGNLITISGGSGGTQSSFSELITEDTLEHISIHNLGTEFPGFFAYDTVTDTVLDLGHDQVLSSGINASRIKFDPDTTSSGTRVTFFVPGGGFVGPQGDEGIAGTAGIDGVDGVDGVDGGTIESHNLYLQFPGSGTGDGNEAIYFGFDYDLTVNQAVVKTTVGNLTYTISIAGTNITGITSQTANTVEATDTATANNSYTTGDEVKLSMSSATNAQEFRLRLKTTRT